MKTLARLVITMGLSWFVADHYSMTPMDGIRAMETVAEKLP